VHSTYETVRDYIHRDSIPNTHLSIAFANRLIDDVLSLSKLDSDLLQITAVACSPLAFTRDVISLFEPELQSKEITYSLEVCDGYRQLVTECAKVDPQRVTQVVSLPGCRSRCYANSFFLVIAAD
jgi:signal transduction histidine kinase